MTRVEIRDYLRRFFADRKRGCTVGMWARDVAKMDPSDLYKVARTGEMSVKIQRRLSEAIESWRDGKITHLEQNRWEFIGLAPEPAPKMRKGFKITIGPDGVSLKAGPVNRRDYLGDLK